MDTKCMLDVINKLRGTGNFSAKTEQAEENSPESDIIKVENLNKDSSEKMDALTEFLNSPEVVPTENIEKKYTMKDLDDFIESLVKPE